MERESEPKFTPEDLIETIDNNGRPFVGYNVDDKLGREAGVACGEWWHAAHQLRYEGWEEDANKAAETFERIAGFQPERVIEAYFAAEGKLYTESGGRYGFVKKNEDGRWGHGEINPEG